MIRLSFTKQSNFRNGTIICFLHFINVTDVALGQTLSTSQIYINDDKQMYFKEDYLRLTSTLTQSKSSSILAGLFRILEG